jgi:hypothetical protein
MTTIMTTLYGICRAIINLLRYRILSNVQDHVFTDDGVFVGRLFRIWEPGTISTTGTITSPNF